jgi:7-cyano-7-deazaguanine tRNA-ribosyltransferase
MSFEVRDKDLAGRIGILHTRRGNVETPCLMPVVNPVKNSIPPLELREKFGYGMIITNSYLILKHFGRNAPDVHEIMNFDGPIMTDSGAYQLLIYGGVDTNPKEIVKFQERIKSDIGVILDTPTGGYASWEEGKATVEETIKRAKLSVGFREDRSMLWAGPIQGGRHLDLVKRSAKRMGSLEYDTHPLGSPVQIMEGYDYAPLVDMIVAAKENLPPERPLHLFGAGHPMMLSLAVALGCDLFDSAAYALFAKDGRYMTPTRTIRIEDLAELPCCCPICSNHSVNELVEMPRRDMEALLSRHNLYVTMQEIKTIKQSLIEGSLWELIETRCRAHPKLFEAFKRLAVYSKYLESNDPIIGKRIKGIFLYDKASLVRPEITRYKDRVVRRYHRPLTKDVLLLLPNPSEKPFNKSKAFEEANSRLAERSKIHICFYGEPFGIVPSELAETFPLSQYESSVEGTKGLRIETIRFIQKQNYKKTIIVDPKRSLKIKNTTMLESIKDITNEVFLHEDIP